MEILDICTEEGLPTGETVERETAHRDGILHRTAHVWIVRLQGGRWQVLLQKRSMNKDSFPGLYDTSSAGHIPAGVEPVPSALRELEEELGIRAEAAQLHPAGTFRIDYEEVFHGKPFHDNEFTSVYVYEEPVDETALRLQAEEIESVRWFDLEEVRDGLGPGTIFCVPAPGFDVMRNYLERKPQR